jgi:hypothetical protein
LFNSLPPSFSAHPSQCPVRPACLVVGGNWLGCFFVSSFFVRFLSDIPTSLGALYFMLCSSPCTRLGLVRAWMIGVGAMGKCQACMNPQRPLLQLFPPKIAYRFPPELFHSSRGVHHTTSSCAKKTSRGTRAQVRRFSTFPSSHQSVWSLSRVGLITSLPILTSIPYILQPTIAP